MASCCDTAVFLAKDETSWLSSFAEACAAQVPTHCVILLRPSEDEEAPGSRVNWIRTQSSELSRQNLLQILSLTNSFETPLVFTLSTELSGLPFPRAAQIVDLSAFANGAASPPKPDEPGFLSLLDTSRTLHATRTPLAVHEALRLELTQSAAAGLRFLESERDQETLNHLHFLSLESSQALATWDLLAARKTGARAQEQASAKGLKVATASSAAILDGMDAASSRLLSRLAKARSGGLRLLRQTSFKRWPGAWRLSTLLARPLTSRAGKAAAAALDDAMKDG